MRFLRSIEQGDLPEQLSLLEMINQYSQTSFTVNTAFRSFLIGSTLVDSSVNSKSLIKPVWKFFQMWGNV